MGKQRAFVWFYTHGIVLLSWINTTFTSDIFAGITREYCLSDTFNPNCDEGEAVLMEHALYGRMQLGRCVKRDRGSIGCSSNELATFDALCSGRQTCTVSIYNEEISSRLECLDELNPYLKAKYTCQKVTVPKVLKCVAPETVIIPKTGGFLSSQVSLETACGAHRSPWILEAKPGQTINISLVDFGWSEEQGQIGCNKKYGYIIDIATDDIINICGGLERERLIYASSGHRVQVVFEIQQNQDNRFLVKYQALGCPTYTAPDHTRTDVMNNSLVVECLSSGETWKLKCINGIWLGVVGTCKPRLIVKIPITSTVAQESKAIKLPNMSTNHVLAFGLGCLTLLICCTVVIVGYYCTKKFEADCSVKSIKENSLMQPTLLRTLPINQGSMTYKPTLSKGTLPSENTALPSYSTTLRKGQKAPPIPQRTASYRGDMSESMMSDYLAPQGGDDNSVTYYILENPTESGGKEEMYQSIHLFSSLERNQPDNA